MKLLPILTVIIASSTLFSATSLAKDKDKDKNKNKKKKHSDSYYYEQRPNVSVGIASPRRPYYGPSSAVIVERERPVYYERPAYSERTTYTTRPTYSSRSIEVDVQRGLARQGYYRGPIDGDIGPGTRSSIRAFQADHGFSPTGRIDRGLLEALR